MSPNDDHPQTAPKSKVRAAAAALVRRSRAALWGARNPDRLDQYQTLASDRLGGKLRQALDEVNPWWMATLLKDMPERERHILGAALLQDADVLFRIERPPHVWFAQPGPDDIVSQLIEQGAYEPAEVEAVLGYAAKHRPVGSFPLVVDVGANLGTTTVPVAAAGYSVVAIEPVPQTVRLLRMNLHANDLVDRCTVVEAAVGSGLDEVDMFVGSNLSMSEAAAYGIAAPEQARPGSGDYRVDLIRVRSAGLSELLAAEVEPAQVALVWSDTEGSEHAVVETGGELWSAGVPLWLELNPWSLGRHGGSDRLLQSLRSAFERFVPMASLVDDPESPVEIPIGDLPDFLRSIGDGPYDYRNALFVPRGP